MQNNTGMLLRFIDLGLVLLMSFLVIADLRQPHQEPLPSTLEGSGGSSTSGVYAIEFTSTMEISVLDFDNNIICQASTPNVAAKGIMECDDTHHASRLHPPVRTPQH